MMAKKKKQELDVIDLNDEMTFTLQDVIFIVEDVWETSGMQDGEGWNDDDVRLAIRRVMEHKEIESRIDGFIESQIDMRMGK